MALVLKLHYYLLCVVALLPVLCNSQSAFVSSRATYYGTPDSLGTPTGSCGFAEYGRTVNDGKVAGVSKLYRKGAGCGACYQVKCKVPKLCIKDGVTVVATDNGEGDRTDFVLSMRAFNSLATANKALELKAFGVVDVEYRRVKCPYPSSKLMLKVLDKSRYPDYLAVIILNYAGLDDIISMQYKEEEDEELQQLTRTTSKEKWKNFRNPYGKVGDINNPPASALFVRINFSGDDGETSLEPDTKIPSDWTPGDTFEL